MTTATTPKLFTVIFEDGSAFMGGTLMDTKWLEIPNKKIKRLFYRLPHGDYICLPGYEKYYHFVEATTDLTGKNKGKVILHFAYVMGRIKDNVIIYKISLKNTNNYIMRDKKNINDEWIQKLNINGWK